MAAAAISCSGDKEDDREQKIVRLDRLTHEYPKMDAARRSSVRDSFGTELTALVRVMGLGDRASDEVILAWADTQPVKIFSPLVDKEFPNLDELEKALGKIIGNAEESGLKIPHYSYATVVWGKPKSIIFADSVVLIALNHYLGPENPAYANWPEYIRNQKRRELLPYDITEAIVATNYPYQPADARPAAAKPAVVTDPDDQSTADDIPDFEPVSDGTLLNRLLYEGALAYAKTQLVPDADVTLALAEELRELEPFGEGNPEPIFGLKGVFFADVKPLGAEGKHLSVTLRKSGLRAIRWSGGDEVEHLRAESAQPHDIQFTLTVSDYGERHVELRLVSIA